MSKKILIVDDSKTDLIALEEALSSTQALVYKASSGAEALRIASSEAPDIIFLDIVMEEMSGFDACRALRKGDNTSTTPIIFVSSKCSKADKLWAQKQGGDALIGKPFKKEEILEQIQRLGL